MKEVILETHSFFRVRVISAFPLFAFGFAADLCNFCASTTSSTVSSTANSRRTEKKLLKNLID